VKASESRKWAERSTPEGREAYRKTQRARYKAKVSGKNVGKVRGPKIKNPLEKLSGQGNENQFSDIRIKSFLRKTCLLDHLSQKCRTIFFLLTFEMIYGHNSPLPLQIAFPLSMTCFLSFYREP